MDLNNELINIKTISNKNMDELAKELANLILNREDIFKTSTVVVPSLTIAQYFKMYWLRNYKDSVLGNVSFKTIDEFFLPYVKTEKHYTLATKRQIRDSITKYLSNCKKEELDLTISSYIYDGSNINGIKLYDLANNLTSLFIDYENDDFAIPSEKNYKEDIIYTSVMEDLFNNKKTTLYYLFSKGYEFKKTSDDIIFFGFNSLKPLYIKLLNEFAKINNVKILILENSPQLESEYKYFAAPNKNREIEVIHSEICKLLKDQTNEHKSNDFLVLAPDISIYEREISKVFNQDGVNFPNIPYNISDFKSYESDITIGLKKLNDIAKKGFFTRLDFAELITNSAIQQARNITLDNVDNFERAIIEMNVFRNGKSVDDWQYAKKRLILAKVANVTQNHCNLVELVDTKYTPYARMDLDDQSLIKLFNIIDDLNDFIKNFKDNQNVKNDNCNLLKEHINKWFSVKDLDGSESNKTVLKLINELDYWAENNLTNSTIPFDTLFNILVMDSVEHKSVSSNLFGNGVSFADYNDEAILSANHIFLIGLSSNNFPILKEKSELDLRKDIDNSKELYDKFLTQCANALKTLSFSYVHKDLSTDETFYPSSLLNKLLPFDPKDKKAKKKIEAEVIDIDETRDISELFTKKENKERDYYVGLFKPNTYSRDDSAPAQFERPRKITLSKLKDFLEEPLKAKFNLVFGHDDGSLDEINDEFEPISISSLTNYNIICTILLYLLENKSFVFRDSSGNIDYQKFNFILERYIYNHEIPDINPLVRDKIIRSSVDDAVEVYDEIVKITDNKYQIISINDFVFDFNGSSTVIYSDNRIVKYVDNDVITYFDIRKGDNDKSKALKVYLCSLMDVTSFDDDKDYKIVLYVGDELIGEYTINKNKAQELLKNIYEEATNLDENIYMSIKNINSYDKLNKVIESLTTPHSPWEYFEDSKLFDYDKDLGYDKNTFNDAKDKYIEKLEDMILYYDVNLKKGDK